MPLCKVSVLKLRAIPLSTMTTLGPEPNLPAARVIYPVHCILVHQEEGVAVTLNAGLQAIGGGYGTVTAGRSTVHKKDSWPP